MRVLSENIRFLLLLVLLGAGILSCSKDVEEVSHAEVTFTATLQEDETHVRAFGDGLSVDRLVVGIFNESLSEIERKEFPVESTSIHVRLALAKEQTYHFVFWTYSSECEVYDITDLTTIRMKNDITNTTFAQAEKSDAFFATVKDFEVTTSTVEEVKLIRPLAQINVGTSGQAVKTSFTIKDVATTFYPFTETVGGESTSFTWFFDETTTETFEVKGKTYTHLAMGYVFAPLGESIAMTKACELILTETDKKMEFPSVELHANHRSNIVGSFTE